MRWVPLLTLVPMGVVCIFAMTVLRGHLERRNRQLLNNPILASLPLFVWMMKFGLHVYQSRTWRLFYISGGVFLVVMGIASSILHRD